MTSGRIRAEAVSASVADRGHGAICLFLGVVRASHAGRRVRAISYDAFLPLASKELVRIADEAERRWPARVSAVHRVGRLGVGEISVAVAAGSRHRPEAFAAGRWTIDEIKRRLPVWKKEHYVEGDGRWLPGCALHRRKR